VSDATGVADIATGSIPEAPDVLSPQQVTVVSLNNAHALSLATSTSMTLESPVTGRGDGASAKLPMPSCPVVFAPQQLTDPAARRAQADFRPSANPTTFEMPVRASGVAYVFAVPPTLVGTDPQQDTEPVLSTAHAAYELIVIDATLEMAGATRDVVFLVTPSPWVFPVSSPQQRTVESTRRAQTSSMPAASA
jgi:hypothetical protein